MTDWKPKNLDEELDNIIGGALNDNAGTIGVSRDGEPIGPEFIHEDDFDAVVKQAIKEIQKSKYIEIKFKGDNELLRHRLSRRN